MADKKEIYFENVIGIGDLYLDYVFLKFDYEPIFFTCQDAQRQLYMCLCSEIRGEQRWVISKCEFNILQLLVEGKMDMVTAICASHSLIQVFRDLKGNEISNVIKATEIDRLELPEDGVVLKCNMMNAVNYITNKKLEILSGMVKESFFYRKSAVVYENTFSQPASQVITSDFIKEHVRVEVGTPHYYSDNKLDYYDIGMDENILKAS